MLRVLIAEDSPVIQRTLTALLEGEEGIEIVGIADNGEDALRMCADLRPDLVTMDIFMPRMDGLEATRRIMDECPTRIVIISAMVGAADMRRSFDAMRAGALDVIEKPKGVLAGNYTEVKRNLIKVLKKMSAARPAAQMSWLPSSPPGAPTAEIPKPSAPAPSPTDACTADRSFPTRFEPQVVALGGSTGAPTVILEILSSLPADYPFPIVVAQHISPGFGEGLASWLNSSSLLDVRIARAGDKVTAGTVLVAPDDRHMKISSSGSVRFLNPLTPQEHIPSVDRLFHSVADVYGDKAMAILLSGMGKDGANGIAAIYEAGGATAGQNESTSVIYGMASVAMKKGVIMREESPSGLAGLLLSLATS